MFSFSVVVATFNRPDYLRRVLESILSQTQPGDEVLVVDDGGEPPELPEGVRYLTQPHRGYRLASARNMGLRAARNPIVVCLADDVVPRSGFLDALRSEPWGRLYLMPHLYMRDRAGASGFWVDAPAYMKAGLAEGGYGGCCAYRLDDAKAVGGYDVKFDGAWGYEDTALMHALMCSGVSVGVCSAAEADHLWHPATSRPADAARNRAIYRGLAYGYRDGIFPKFPS